MPVSDPAAETLCWVRTVVIGLGLCPFAARVVENGQLSIRISDADSPEALLQHLLDELQQLEQVPAEETDTVLLVHPGVLQDFDDYNEFLGLVDLLLEQEGFEGVFQVASFHPDYRFGGVSADDVSNYTNRSPYPMLHIIREHSLEQAIASFPDVDAVPQKNIETMQKLGADRVLAMLAACRV